MVSIHSAFKINHKQDLTDCYLTVNGANSWPVKPADYTDSVFSDVVIYQSLNE